MDDQELWFLHLLVCSIRGGEHVLPMMGPDTSPEGDGRGAQMEGLVHAQHWQEHM